MIDLYKQLTRDVIQYAKKCGADTVTVSVGRATTFQVEVREGQIDLLKESGSSGIHISLSKEHKRSSVSSNDLRLETLKPLIKSTIQTLPYMGEDPFYTLPDPSLQGRAEGDLKFEDPQYSQFTTEEKVQMSKALEQEVLARDPKLKSEQAYYSDTLSHSVYADSNGFIDGITKTLYSLGVTAFAEDQDSNGLNSARKQTDGWYSCTRFYHQLEPLEHIAEKTCERVLRKLGAVKPKSQELAVVFSPEMARSFLGSLSSAMMGDNIFRKNSFLVDRLGTTIATKAVQLQDEPLLAERLGSRYYDGEGVRAKPLTLLEEGILQNYMLSTYSANKLGMTTTGHSNGTSNLVLIPGNYSEEELIASTPEGLYLTFMSGQGANITTGDYSRGAQGLMIRDGKLAESVQEFTIASTYLNILNNIHMIAKDIDLRSSILSPAFKVEKMAISGS
ncbi:TldD/PmbA family protein [Deltaproteobacteria bacterium TL4]